MTEHRCDQCAHADLLRGVHPMRCRAPVLTRSLPATLMREDGGLCGPRATLWEPREKYHADI